MRKRMSDHRSKSENSNAEKQLRRDLYDVLGLSRKATDQEIKSAYRKMALKYHPDKNANDSKAADIFKEVTFLYNILSDPDKRRQYDTAGFEAVEEESQELELDLSSLGAINTMFAAIFSKLGVKIKTTVSATVLEEALNGSVHSSTWTGEASVEEGRKAMFSFLFCDNNGDGSTGWICLPCAIIRQKQIQSF